MAMNPRLMRPKASGPNQDPPGTPSALLMHFDGSNGSTSFTDSSSNNATCTAFGSAAVSTGTVKFGTGSLNIPGGTSDRVVVADKTAGLFDLTGDFTVEAWVYPTTAASYRTIVTRYNGSNNAWVLRFDGSASALTSVAWYAGAATGSYYNFNATISLNQWYHVAVCRKGSSIRAFLNGTQIGSTQTNSGTMTGGTAGCMIGSSNQSGFQFPFAGYIDDLRITLAGIYDSSFTPPTAAFPDI